MELIESMATDTGSIFNLYVNILQPAQREIGRLWQVNSISVAVEHYATATAQQILHRLSRMVPRGPSGTRASSVSAAKVNIIAWAWRWSATCANWMDGTHTLSERTRRLLPPAVAQIILTFTQLDPPGSTSTEADSNKLSRGGGQRQLCIHRTLNESLRIEVIVRFQ